MEKIYRVQLNSKGMPNFSTAVEIEDIPIYGNEHNCMMTIFGECSYAETGCGDCAVVEKVRKALSADRPQEWIPCSERLPETDNTNKINEFDVLLAVRPKKHPEETPQVYIGKLRPVKGDDGSGNFWGVKIAPCEWTIWGWSYFQEPEVLAWMPLPKPWKGADDE